MFDREQFGCQVCGPARTMSIGRAWRKNARPSAGIFPYCPTEDGAKTEFSLARAPLSTGGCPWPYMPVQKWTLLSCGIGQKLDGTMSSFERSGLLLCGAFVSFQGRIENREESKSAVDERRIAKESLIETRIRTPKSTRVYESEQQTATLPLVPWPVSIFAADER